MGEVGSSIGAKLAALIEAARKHGFDGMSVTERRRLATLRRFIAERADPDAPELHEPETSTSGPQPRRSPYRRRP
jgi:hypothetical protein